jgi:hypothetical protein
LEEEDMAKLLTSKNHSSETPRTQVMGMGIELEKRKSKMKPCVREGEEFRLKPFKTPQTSGDRRRSITASSDAAVTSLGSTMTPAGVRQSARIRASRQQS